MEVERIEPGPGQESVWDYPRPPRVEPVAARVRVEFGGRTVIDSTEAVRVLETSHPPQYYVPRSAVTAELLPAIGATLCEFKGAAKFLTLRVGDHEARAAIWYYPNPSPGYEVLAGMVSLYPGRMDRCEVGGETVTAQDSAFYGGWITHDIVGPFKGAPGTLDW